LTNEEDSTLPRRLLGYVVKAITYVLLAVGFVAGTIWVTATFKEEHVRLFFYWLIPVLYTAALFGYIIKETRSFWRVRMFWSLLGLSFLVHLGVFVYVFGWIITSMNALRFRLCFIAIGVEGAGIFMFLAWTLERFGHRRRNGRPAVRRQQNVSVNEQ
jgi:hypothetical protein